ncbi:MAG: DpnI domain-containing protein [Candidatus Acidiferrales bacterium]
MQNALPTETLGGYTSGAQRARVATEAWAHANLYCPNCDSASLARTPINTPVVDYLCPGCRATFQLKSQARAFSRKIVDAAYESMIRAIRENRTPNLFVLHYDSIAWAVEDIIVISCFAFPFSAIEKRRPLGPAARRAGWVGCNIRLDAIPADAKIRVVFAGTAVPNEIVRRQYARVRPLAKLGVEQRGWTLDVLNVVRSMEMERFSLADIYGHVEALVRLHPRNRHVRDKIRQQLQVLRDLGLLEFLGSGRYRIL